MLSPRKQPEAREEIIDLQIVSGAAKHRESNNFN
jgi:hypothetical protein